MDVLSLNTDINHYLIPDTLLPFYNSNNHKKNYYNYYNDTNNNNDNPYHLLLGSFACFSFVLHSCVVTKTTDFLPMSQHKGHQESTLATWIALGFCFINV